MSDIIAQLEAEQMTREVPGFAPGDTVVVQVKVKEGERERLQGASHPQTLATLDGLAQSLLGQGRVDEGVAVDRRGEHPAERAGARGQVEPDGRHRRPGRGPLPLRTKGPVAAEPDGDPQPPRTRLPARQQRPRSPPWNRSRARRGRNARRPRPRPWPR